MVVLCCGLNLLMIRKIPRTSVLSYPPFLRYFKLTKTTQWSDRSKGFQLFIIVLAAIVPDFDSGIGLKYLLSHSECVISCMLYRDCICFRFGQAVPDFVSWNHQFDFKVRKKVFTTFIYILEWYSLTGSWSIFLIGKILMLCFFHSL